MPARLAAKSVHCEKWNMTLQRSESHAKKQSGQCFKRRIIAEFIMAKCFQNISWRRASFCFVLLIEFIFIIWAAQGCKHKLAILTGCPLCVVSTNHMNPMTPILRRDNWLAGASHKPQGAYQANWNQERVPQSVFSTFGCVPDVPDVWILGLLPSNEGKICLKWHMALGACGKHGDLRNLGAIWPVKFAQLDTWAG